MTVDTKKQAQELTMEIYSVMTDNETVLSETTLLASIRRYLGIAITMPTTKLPPYQRFKVENLKGVMIQEGWFSGDRDHGYTINVQKIRRSWSDGSELAQPEAESGKSGEGDE